MKRITASILAVAVTAVLGSAAASAQNYGRDSRDSSNGPRYDRAQVIRVDRIGDRYDNNRDQSYQRQECWDEQTNRYDDGYYRDNSGRLYRSENHTNTGGMLIGALVGGALGNTVGKGDGRKAATIAGAVIGGTVGAHVNNNDNNDYQYRGDNGVVRRCRTVVVTDNGDNRNYDNHGYGQYQVTYRYGNQTYRSITNNRPGRFVRVLVDVRLQDDGR